MIRFLAQATAYGIFAAFLGMFSIWPGYRLLGDEQAIVSITFSHAAKRVEACRRLTQEELNALPPNMRRPDECPRERHPVRVELRVDDKLIYTETALPSGLWRDGKANVYQRVTIDAGDHAMYVGMSDSGSGSTYDYELRQEMTLVPSQNLVISFDDLQKTFVIE